MKSKLQYKITLALQKPFLKTFFLTFFFLLIFSLIIEFTLRLNVVEKYLGAPYLGSTHRQLEVQVARLKIFAEKQGKVDCLFIGSSMVWLGINPLAFREEIMNNTGKDLTCFNFGVATMPAGAAGVMTDILVNKYHPKIIIFGTSPRDYVIPLEAEDSSVIVDTPWVRYQSGKFSVDGWLYANSYFFGHLKNLNRLFHFDETVFTDIGTSNYDRYGFLPKTRPILQENIQAGIDDAIKWLANYSVLPENVEGLEKIAEYSQRSIAVIIFEMPVQPSYYDHFSNREADYQNYFQAVQNITFEYNIPFIQLTDNNVIPVDGWWNENHLNLKGASAFSSWLADQTSILEIITTSE